MRLLLSICLNPWNPNSKAHQHKCQSHNQKAVFTYGQQMETKVTEFIIASSDLTHRGNLFQRVGVETEKALLPMSVLSRGTKLSQP